ncbi:hypothetical protein [Glutamicibacter arilaitensis]|uniref:hypothetical protein n=1 Tax=Glutamicibacter arilaitensis TaxID=256701 RepID=UPI003F8EA374
MLVDFIRVLESAGDQKVFDAFFFGVLAALGIMLLISLCILAGIFIGDPHQVSGLNRKIAQRIYKESAERVEESALTAVEVGRRDGEGASFSYRFVDLPKE